MASWHMASGSFPVRATESGFLCDVCAPFLTALVPLLLLLAPRLRPLNSPGENGETIRGKLPPLPAVAQVERGEVPHALAGRFGGS